VRIRRLQLSCRSGLRQLGVRARPEDTTRLIRLNTLSAPMSTRFLYHAFGARNYNYLRTEYR
jgi:hypothetical protein